MEMHSPIWDDNMVTNLIEIAVIIYSNGVVGVVSKDYDIFSI